MGNDNEDADPRIQEVTFAVTVLLEADTPQAAAAAVQNADLAGIAMQMDDGDWIGLPHVPFAHRVPLERLTQRLLEIGNDGSFFGDIGGDPFDTASPPPAGAALDVETRLSLVQMDANLGPLAMCDHFMDFAKARGLVHAFEAHVRDEVRLPEPMPMDEDLPHIQEVTFAVTVLVEADTPKEAADMVQRISLEDLGEAIDTGDWIGMVHAPVAHEIPPERAGQRLVDLGNDGTFFDSFTGLPDPFRQQRVLDADNRIGLLQLDANLYPRDLAKFAVDFVLKNGLGDAFEAHLRSAVNLLEPEVVIERPVAACPEL